MKASILLFPPVTINIKATSFSAPTKPPTSGQDVYYSQHSVTDCTVFNLSIQMAV